MNIIKNYIRNKIADLIEWAIGAELAGIKESVRRNNRRIATLESEQQKLRMTIEYVTDVGVDHHLKDNHSWAVICTHGKKGRDIVKFYRLKDNDIDILHKIIKEFGSTTIIDTHPQIIRDLSFL